MAHEHHVPTKLGKAKNTWEDTLVGEESVEVNEDLMTEFMKNVDLIENNIKIIERCNQEIKDIQNRKNSFEFAYKNDGKNVDNIVERCGNARNEIKKTLEEMDADIGMTMQKLESKKNPPEIRAKNQVISNLKLKFRQVLTESSQVQIAYKKSEQDKVKRRLKIVKPDLSEQELEELSNDADSGKKLLNEMVLGPHASILAAVSDIKEKYERIVKLSKSVNQMHKMFEDLGMMVHEQAMMLENIEQNVSQANNYLGKSVGKMQSAKKWYQLAQTVNFGISLIENVYTAALHHAFLRLDSRHAV
eukprot:TRINITY_DN2381_c0_g12_i1.p1 TRINITY_DN2381_c0_g12~~TRINITY_DN2381_c0_g12_i1.p1  ORF type:complete len:303 (+),score=81.22 TRINITY_DN2381_c0_g12_i1:1373-2281(+)